MSGRLDPWLDASKLAARLAIDNARLIVVIGAEQWCSRCRALRPVFDQAAASADPQEVWLWLDVEDHAEFLGDYVPEDLPVLFVYVGDRLMAGRALTDASPSFASLVDSYGNDSAPATLPEPGIRDRLLTADWAPDRTN